MSDLFDDLRRAQKMIDEAPPTPRVIWINHSVPYGRIFRQWDTKGDLYAWVNPGVVHDIPRAEPKRNRLSWSDTDFLTGIPVVER